MLRRLRERFAHLRRDVLDDDGLTRAQIRVATRASAERRAASARPRRRARSASSGIAWATANRRGDIRARQQVDPARVGELRDHDRRGALQQLAEVRPCGQQLAHRTGQARGALLALALRDLHHDRAELRRRPVRAVHRIEVREPVALDAGLRGSLPGDLDVTRSAAPVSRTSRSIRSTCGPISGSTSETRRPRWSSMEMPLLSASGWFRRTYRRSRS